tara:strand:- start:537 stop:1049 length:513 start_codon:yes stop_codon:yes gene_type:complete
MQACAAGQWVVLNDGFGARSTSIARQGIAPRCPGRGVDEQTPEVRAVEVTGSNIGDAPMLPELLNQIPGDQEIGSVTAPSRQIVSQSPAGQRTEHTTPAIAIMPLRPVVPMPSSRRAKTPSLGNLLPLVRSPETRLCAHRNTWAARFGGIGVATTAEAASRQNLSGSCFA